MCGVFGAHRCEQCRRIRISISIPNAEGAELDAKDANEPHEAGIKPRPRAFRLRQVLLAVALVWLPLDFLLCAPSVTYRSGTPVSLLRDAVFCTGRPRDGGVVYSLRRTWSVRSDSSIALFEGAPDDPSLPTGEAWVRVHYRWGGLVHQLWYTERAEFTIADYGQLSPDQRAALTRLFAMELAPENADRVGVTVQRALALEAVHGKPAAMVEYYWRALALDVLFIASAIYILWNIMAWRAKRRTTRTVSPDHDPHS